MKPLPYKNRSAVTPTKIDVITSPVVAKREGNMKVRILYAGKYLDPDRLPLWKAKHREVGEVVEFPLDYAEGIIASELARQVSEGEVTTDAVVEIERGEVEVRPIDATKGAIALAEEMSIDLATVQGGSGADGRITMRDVEKLR